MDRYAHLSELLEPPALTVLGHTSDGPQTLALIGPDEPAFWDRFTDSPEYRDGEADPMDRWSRRVLTDIATQVEGEAVFPFGGPPFEPFQSWALASGQFWTSPIGFLVHQTRGLFVSFRGAIRLPVAQPTPVGASPCPDCPAPCAVACPVDAFRHGYDVAACKAHIATPAGRDCLTRGCRARRACPVGQGLRLPDHARFHMEAFA